MSAFNWVSETFKCSPEMVLGTLREVVDSDVKAVNGLNRSDVSFTLNDDALNKIVVIRRRDMAGFIEGMGVVFELRARQIHVYSRTANGEKPLFVASPRVSPEDGECTLAIDGTPMRLWQVSRKALEDLFFGF